MAEGVVAQNLQNQAEGHRRDAESMVTDCAHTHKPRDYDRQEAQPGKLAIDALMGAEPEEANEEEADTSEHPEPRDELSNAAINQVIALLATSSDIENWINLEPWISRHRSIHDWT